MAAVETRYTRSPDFIFRKIVKEVVLVPVHQSALETDCIYSLNGVGAYIWQTLATPAAESEIVQAVLHEYAVDPSEAASDVRTFLAEMTAIGALREV